MTDIVERLRGFGPDWTVKQTGAMVPYEVCVDAANEIERLRAVLKPFADVAAAYERSNEITAQHYRDERGADYKYPAPQDWIKVESVTLGDCRKAKIAYEQNEFKKS